MGIKYRNYFPYFPEINKRISASRYKHKFIGPRTNQFSVSLPLTFTQTPQICHAMPADHQLVEIHSLSISDVHLFGMENHFLPKSRSKITKKRMEKRKGGEKATAILEIVCPSVSMEMADGGAPNKIVLQT